jgi:exopolysaccharide production protein ExoQ
MQVQERAELMATAVYFNDQSSDTSILQEVSCWLMLLPALFIAVNGRIQTESAPVAFRFTAMEEDSLTRKFARLGCSLLILLLLSGRVRATIASCLRSKLLLLLPSIALTSTLWSANPRHTLVDALNLFLTTLFALHVLSRYPGGRIISFLNILAFVSLSLCVISVVAFPGVGIDAYQQDAWRGIFGQRNNCAAICVLFLIVALHAYTRDAVEQLIRSVNILLSLVFIVMSGSRTGWIVAAIAIALTYGVRLAVRFKSLDRLFFMLVLVVPITLFGILIGVYSTEILAALDKDPTLTQRTIIWATVIPSIMKHPFVGYGYSAFWAGLHGESAQTVLTTGWMQGQAQDGYLDILLQIGLLGLIPIIFLFLRALGQAGSLIHHKMRDPSVLMAIVLIPIILIENIGESSLLMPLGLPWFYALIAVAILGTSKSQMEAH